jgi:hypothetical protein
LDSVLLVVVLVSVCIIALFNYYLNLAPGSDPDDFAVGPAELNITCDCSLNTLILGGILVIAFSAISSMFSSRLELYFVGTISFIVVTAAGLFGRRKRHAEWKEDEKVIRRAIQKAPFGNYGRDYVDVVFDEEDDDDRYYYDEP